MENNNKKNVILEVKNLKKYFPLNKDLFGRPQAYLKAVDNVSFKLEAGKTIGVVGESGCGKTTLGRTILQLYDTTGGKTLYYGHTVEEKMPKYYIKEITNLPKYKSKFNSLMNKLKELLNDDDLFDLSKVTLENFKNKLSEETFNLNSLRDKCEKNETIDKLEKVTKALNSIIEVLEHASESTGGKILSTEENTPLFLELESRKEMGLDLARLSKKELRSLRPEIQLIFQDPYSSLPPRMTIGSILKEPVEVHKVVEKDKINEHVRHIMKVCGLQPQYYDRYPHEFSGGQRQRICIARALVVNPKLVICDEPVSALDVSIQAQIINLLKELQNNLGLTYMFISHDLSVVKYITDSIIVMYLGNMMEIGNTNDIFENPLHPYTKALFSAVPVPDPDAKMKRIILKGDIPSPANPPKGCKFHTRCEKCMAVCKLKTPEFIECEANHLVACHLYNDEVMKNLDKYEAELVEIERIEQEKAKELEEKKLKKNNRIK